MCRKKGIPVVEVFHLRFFLSDFSRDQNFWLVVGSHGFKLRWAITTKSYKDYLIKILNLSDNNVTRKSLPSSTGEDRLTVEYCSLYRMALVEISTQRIMKVINFVSQPKSEFPFYSTTYNGKSVHLVVDSATSVNIKKQGYESWTRPNGK